MRSNLDFADLRGCMLWEKNRFGQIVQALTGTYTMDDDMPLLQFLDPGGAGREVRLPAVAKGLFYILINTADANEDLTVKESTGVTTIGVVTRGARQWFFCDGTTWWSGQASTVQLESLGSSTLTINARDFTQTSGDTIGAQIVPNQAATTTGEVYGIQIKPRVAAGFNAATVNGMEVDSEVKSGAGALSSDLRGINMYLGATGAGTIGGNIVGIRFRAESNINPTGHIVAMHVVNHEGSQAWDGLVKFTEALGSHSMTTATDKTGNAKSGTIKVIANDTEYHIQLYAAA